MSGVAHPTRFHGGILGGAGNRVRNTNGMRAGETWSADWRAEMEAFQKDGSPRTTTDLRSGPVMKPDLSNGFLRLAYYPFRTEQELLEKLEADMRRYPTLAEGWDGYGAEPLIPESLDDGRKFLAHRPKGVKVPFAELSPTGEFGLYWEEGRAFAQAIFEGNGKYYYLACCRPPAGEDIWHHGDDCDADSCWPAGLLEVVREVDRATQDWR